MAKKITITKDRSITQKKILKILADVTEQPIYRPEDSKKRNIQEKRKLIHSIKYADSGYQGWQKLQKNVIIPFELLI